MHDERKKPLLIFDGDCAFCKLWIDRWRCATGDAVDYAPFQEVAARFPGISRAQFERSVQHVATDGKVTGGAEAVFLALAAVPKKRWLLRLYRKFPPFAWTTEAGYRFIARRRSFAYRVSTLLLGKRGAATCEVPPQKRRD